MLVCGHIIFRAFRVSQLQSLDCRWQIEAGTRIVLCENVVSGTVHRACSETFARSGQYSLQTIHCATEDTGFGGIKRYRAWNHV